MKQLGQIVTFVIPRMEGISKAHLVAIVHATIYDMNLKSENNFLAELKKACTEWVKTTDEGKRLWQDSSQDLNIGDIAQQGDLEELSLLMDGVMDDSLSIEIYGGEPGDWMYDSLLVNQDEVTDEIYVD